MLFTLKSFAGVMKSHEVINQNEAMAWLIQTLCPDFSLYKQNNNKTVKTFWPLCLNNTVASFCFSKYFFLSMGLLLSACFPVQ